MRRKDKEITDNQIIAEVLNRSVVCRIAINDTGSPYIIPLNYGYRDNALYFHSAPAGRKIDLLRREPKVSFEVEDYYSIVSASSACGWTTHYRSVMGTGIIEFVTGNDEKKRGLDIIMNHHGSRGENVYREGGLDNLIVLKLNIESVTCKQSGGDEMPVLLSAEMIETAKQLKALAETGLIYQDNLFDRERYTQIRDISIRMLAEITAKSVEQVEAFYEQVKDYPTPKVDIRGLVINEKGEVLLVREKIDGRWSIPGGWADIGMSPSETIVKEVREESGLEAIADRLLAVYDKRCHPHPPSAYYIYKIVFLCRITGGNMTPGFDILEAGWFRPDNLPELSTDRILATQIRELYSLAADDKNKAVYD